MTTGLYKAVIEGRFQQVKFYLESGVRLGRHGGNEVNLLLAALQLEIDVKRRQMYNFLLHRGANYWDIDNETGRDGLLWACYMNRIAQVRKLIKYAVGNLNFATQDKQGNCGLHFAVKHNNIDLLKLLLKNWDKYGLCVDVADKEGLTPLLHAKHLGYDDLVQVLVQAGASDHRADDVTLSPAHAWQNAGKLMRNIERHKRKENQGVYGRKLAINVVPQFDPRGLYRTKTTLWNRSQTKHVTLKSPALYQKSYSLPSNYRKNSIDKLRSILKYRPDEKTLLVDVQDTDDGDYVSSYTTPDVTGRSLPAKDEKAVAASISQIMSLLSDQIGDAYRDPAVDKIKQTILQKQKPNRRVTTLNRINNRIKVKADEQEKKAKLKKELERQTRALKHRTDSTTTAHAQEKEGKPTVMPEVTKAPPTAASTAADKASREPSKIGLLR